MKICKQMMSVLLALAMTLSLVGAVTVGAESATNVINVTEQVVDADAGVSKLVISAVMPAGSYAGAEVIFSYDSTAVQPVSIASRIRYSSFLVLLPPKAGPVASSRLM